MANVTMRSSKSTTTCVIIIDKRKRDEFAVQPDLLDDTLLVKFLKNDINLALSITFLSRQKRWNFKEII